MSKIHIFPPNEKLSLCRRDWYAIDGFSTFVSTKTLAENNDIICKNCVRILLKRRD